MNISTLCIIFKINKHSNSKIDTWNECRVLKYLEHVSIVSRTNVLGHKSDKCSKMAGKINDNGHLEC